MKKINFLIFILAYCGMAFLLGDADVPGRIYIVSISWSGLIAISYARVFPMYLYMIICVVWSTVTTTFFRNLIEIFANHA